MSLVVLFLVKAALAMFRCKTQVRGGAVWERSPGARHKVRSQLGAPKDGTGPRPRSTLFGGNLGERGRAV